jgi:hypothetical protein
MPGAKIVNIGEKSIVLIDFVGADLDEVIRVVGEAKNLIRSQARHSVLTLTDVRDARFTPALARVMKEFAHDNAEFVKAGAVVGLSGATKVIYDAVIKFTGRNLPVFPDREKATAWLMEQ